MKKLQARLVTLAALAAVACTLISKGQTPANPPAGAPVTPVPTADQQPRMDIDLPPDSKLGDLIAWLEKNYPQYALNISDKALKDVVIGQMKLRNATMMELSMALRQSGRGQFNIMYGSNNTAFIRKMPQAAPPPPLNNGDQPKMDIDLPEGSTIGDLIDLLKKKYPQYGYSLSTWTLKEVKIGKLELAGATVSQLVDALNREQGRQFFVIGGGLNLWFADGRPLQSDVLAFNIGAWLGDTSDGAATKKIGQLDDMIKQTIQTANTSSKKEIPTPKSIYLPTGKIYVLVGTQEAVILATAIMDTLDPKVVPSRTPMPRVGD